jgi:hypothetical protein
VVHPWRVHLHSASVPPFGDLATGCRGRGAGGLVVGCSHAGRWRILNPLAALCTPSCGARVGGTRGVGDAGLQERKVPDHRQGIIRSVTRAVRDLEDISD